ncbi:MAG: metal-sulfur cluster assembly factor [Candidatus Micrarchaeaceae archaeon]
MVSRKEIVEVLTECIDPEVGANIVDIGLIYNISIKENDIKVYLTMTSPMCPVMSIILADVQLRLKKIPGVNNIDLELVWDPMWTPEMMADSLKSTYGVY